MSPSTLKDVAKRVVRNLLPAAVRFQRSGKGFLASGEQEIHELPQLVEPGTAAIDVGALVGDYAYTLCNLVGRDGLVICVEPQPEYARVLRKAARSLKLPMRVVECALSSREGVAELKVPVVDGRQKNGFASLDHEIQHGKTIRVPLRRLDDITAGLEKRLSFLKVDVEGHELEVFKGCVETLKQHRPNLLVEIEQRHSRVSIDETFDFIRAQGYSGFFLDAERRRRPLSAFDVRKNQELGPSERTSGASRDGYVSNFIFIAD